MRETRPPVKKRLDASILKLTGGNVLEVVLIACVCLFVVWVMRETVLAALAARYREDLTFSGTVAEVSSLIANQGGEAIASVAPHSATREHEPRGFDSLVVTGDSVAVPSLAKGGFLHDQVDRFNAALAREGSGKDAGREALDMAAVSASLLRVAPGLDNRLEVSPLLNEQLLTVSSPFADTRWTPVRAADGRDGPYLVGLSSQLEMPHRDSGRTGPAILNRDKCWMQRWGKRNLLYCGTTAGAEVGKGFDLGVELASASLSPGPARLLAGRPSPVRVNGARSDSGTPLLAGDLLYRASVGPLMLSDLHGGSLADEQWMNGARSVVRRTEGTIGYFSRASRSINDPSRRPVTLSLRSDLSGELDARLQAFGRLHASYVQSMEVVVADIRTGELLAISELGWSEGRPLHSFEPQLIGSMSKPILAAAILARRPDLARLQVDYAGPSVDRVAGVDVSPAFENARNGCPARITFELFLQCSSNQFAAELFVRALQPSVGKRAIADNGLVPTSTLEESAPSSGLLALFDDVDVVFFRNARRSPRLWRTDDPSPAASAADTPRDASMWPYESRPWFICERDARARGEYCRDGAVTATRDLARFAFGAWENRWTLTGVAEAYARIATGRRVSLTIRARSRAARVANVEQQTGREAYRSVRRGLARVGATGTAAGTNSVFAAIRPGGDALRVLAKTGTLNVPSESVYLKSLAVVVGREAPDGLGTVGVDRELDCGVVAVLRVTFRPDWKARNGKASDSDLPGLHLALANEELAPALARGWSEWDSCRKDR